MNNRLNHSPDGYFDAYLLDNKIDKQIKVEEKTFESLAKELHRDYPTRSLIDSLPRDAYPPEIDMQNTPFWKTILFFKRSVMQRVVGEAKASTQTSKIIESTHKENVSPREVRTDVAMRREYYQLFALSHGNYESTFIPGGVQVGNVGEITFSGDDVGRKGQFDVWIQIHNHPEESFASLIDLQSLEDNINVELITTPKGVVMFAPSGPDNEEKRNDINWLDMGNSEEALIRLASCFAENGCLIDRLKNDDENWNEYGLQVAMSIYSFAVAKYLDTKIYTSKYEDAGLFKKAELPSDVFPSMKDRFFGKNTDEKKLLDDIMKIVLIRR